MQAVLVAVKVVGTVLAAKTMIDGLREGNLLKAVLGGVGAYIGVSSFAANAGSAAAGSEVSKAWGEAAKGASLAEGGGAAVGTATAAEGGSTGLLGSAMGGSEASLGATTGVTQLAPWKVGSDLATGGNAISASADGANMYDLLGGGNQATLGGLGAAASPTVEPTSWIQRIDQIAQDALGKGWDYMKGNQGLLFGAMQGVGSYMTNKSNQDWKERMLNQDRSLRGAVPTGLSQWRFDPVSRQMIKVGG